ncbi:hypothetical protein BXY66_3347 [Shimia isoporae]|uniref:DUF4177 domain-containing protein n=1 Tax=Shimia isoporae TaxID=647720 RepID=A0A4R1N2S3_9RHOB|nr:hypothetical protein [Shimia isoporae]TCL00700.1 hypothetical protein BXY66_3347 [Shimia isoporae]
MSYSLSQITRIAVVGLAISIASPAAAAECYADYKAKKDNPLRLHYGVIALNSGCDKASARTEIKARIAKDGWKLLNVLSVFDKTQLSGKEASAGQFYLRF